MDEEPGLEKDLHVTTGLNSSSSYSYEKDFHEVRFLRPRKAQGTYKVFHLALCVTLTTQALRE